MNRRWLPLVDALILPLTYPAALLLRWVRRTGTHRLKRNREMFFRLGVFPIREHYYEPLFNPKGLKDDLKKERVLPGIDFNEAEQLAMLDSFQHAAELADVPFDRPADQLEYFYGNGSYCSGDAEYLYHMIRHFKPRRIVEVGCGYSTLMMRRAIAANIRADPAYSCEHTCIEPYGPKWLARSGARVISQKVEETGLELFKTLERNDILFIDSSHIIRRQGDVLFEYLEVLPLLKPGVFVHVHDVFTPRDYMWSWVHEEVFFWNEQFLLEAFLSHNSAFKIVGALNWLTHRHFGRMARQCPGLAKQPDREPGAMWLRRV